MAISATRPGALFGDGSNRGLSLRPYKGATRFLADPFDYLTNRVVEKLRLKFGENVMFMGNGMELSRLPLYAELFGDS